MVAGDTMSAKFAIQEILEDHWDAFLRQYPNVRPVVEHEVRKVIGCGNPDNGCALYECPNCGAYKFVPFRCHSRFCNTCGTVYQANRSDSISMKLINCRHRHIVFTIPVELRPYFRKDRSLLHVLFRSSAQVISDWLYTLNHKENFTIGMVISLHTFGRDLKWNPHIHMLASEGAVGRFTKWRPIRYFPFKMLRKRWQTTLLYHLKNALDPELFSLQELKRLTNYLYRAYREGFYVNAPSKKDFNSPMAVANYITRYIGRPAMAQSRITDYDGTKVSYWYQRHEDNEIVHVTEHAFDFIKKLIIHIPEKGFHMLRYYGLYARPDHASSHLIHLVRPFLRNHIRRMHNWVFRIERSFHHDPLKCPCGESMEYAGLYLPNSTHPPPDLLQYYHLTGRRHKHEHHNLYHQRQNIYGS